MSSLMLTMLFASATAEFNLPPNLLAALCFVESSHRIEAVHKDDGGKRDSLGLCQIQHRTAKYMGFEGTADELMEPSTNLYFSAKYLRYQLDRYGSTTKAIIAYNIGNAKGLARTEYSDKVYKQWREMNVKQARTFSASGERIQSTAANDIAY